MQTVENALEACSGCAGDYEDPERSAWEYEQGEEEEEEGSAEFSATQEPAEGEDEEGPHEE